MLDFLDILYWVHIVSTVFGVFFNGVLLYLIKNHTRPEMRKYRRILYQNCLLEVLYAVVSGISQTKVETFGEVNLITPSGVPSATRSEANIITAIWVFSLYAVIFFVPVQFFYRYLIIVREVVITRKLYAVMLIPITKATISPVSH
uniref:G protein-coupled receptor n=1 Tax=Panagrellus redivivus TaxID=6233 RepID=A0A7E4VQW1_PANRE